jgi:uncharacterized protein YigA (DUF484 family)
VADTYELSITREELAAAAQLIAAAQVSGLTEQLEQQFGEEFGVPYASLILKFAIVERVAVPGESPEDTEAIAVFVADLDQRKAALAEREIEGGTE